VATASAADEWRNAIEHDPGPHPVAVGFRPGEHAGGVSQAGLGLGGFGKGKKARNLRLGTGIAALAGTRQMAHETDRRRHRRARFEAPPHGRHLLRREAQTVHAGIGFEPYAQRLVEIGPLQGRYLAFVMYHEIQAQLRRQRQLFVSGYATEQQHGFGDAVGAQDAALLNARHGEGVRLVQRRANTRRAVAVGHAPRRGRRRRP